MAASAPGSGATAPWTPELSEELCPESRIRLLESEVVSLNTSVTTLTRFAEEQRLWIQSQSALLTAQGQLVEALSSAVAVSEARIVRLNDRLTLEGRLVETLSGEGEGIRSRVQMLEDRLTIAEDVIAEGGFSDDEGQNMEDIAPPAVAQPPRRPLNATEIAELLNL